MKLPRISWLPAAALLGALLPLAAHAQVPGRHHASVYRRLHSERQRIRMGAHSGALTHHEAMTLERRAARVQRRAAHDRYMHGGQLTRAERSRLNRRLNRTSTAIYRHKHDMGTK